MLLASLLANSITLLFFGGSPIKNSSIACVFDGNANALPGGGGGGGRGGGGKAGLTGALELELEPLPTT